MKASSVGSTSGAVRARGGETIGEVAAIARQAASHSEAVSPASIPTPMDDDRRDPPGLSPPRGRSESDEPIPDVVIGGERPSELAPMRRARAGVGLLKEPVQSPQADKTAIHLILAGRAYAYGQRIVRKEDGKLGDVLAIMS